MSDDGGKPPDVCTVSLKQFQRIYLPTKSRACLRWVLQRPPGFFLFFLRSHDRNMLKAWLGGSHLTTNRPKTPSEESIRLQQSLSSSRENRRPKRQGRGRHKRPEPTRSPFRFQGPECPAGASSRKREPGCRFFPVVLQRGNGGLEAGGGAVSPGERRRQERTRANGSHPCGVRTPTKLEATQHPRMPFVLVAWVSPETNSPEDLGGGGFLRPAAAGPDDHGIENP